MRTGSLAALVVVGAVCLPGLVGAPRRRQVGAAAVEQSPFAGARPQAEEGTPSWAKVSPEQVAAAEKLGVPVAFENSIGMRFVLIPPGEFMMGSRDSGPEVARRCNMPNAQGGWFLDEHPRHKVALTKAFYMAVHEVSNRDQEAVIRPKPAKNKGKKQPTQPEAPVDPNSPAVNVSWSDAEKFCKELSKRDKRTYALPTEAQWEYACRAGTATPFCFGETTSTDHANYHGGYTYGEGRKGDNRGKPVPVGSLPANAWGLHEMHGNVSEWCADRYGEYAAALVTDPAGAAEGKLRVVRGGSWRSYPGACRSAFRHRREQGARSDTIGFRICCAVQPESAAK